MVALNQSLFTSVLSMSSLVPGSLPMLGLFCQGWRDKPREKPRKAGRYPLVHFSYLSRNIADIQLVCMNREISRALWLPSVSQASGLAM